VTRDHRLPDYLEQMEQAASDALSFVEGMSKDEFLADKRTQQAVTMSLVIIGEAATKLMARFPTFIEQHPEILWRSMRGMRNSIAHDYFRIDLEAVWDTLEVGLPELLGQLPSVRRAACDLSRPE
jgi:uncharacterized protein with HEPN domain